MKMQNKLISTLALSLLFIGLSYSSGIPQTLPLHVAIATIDCDNEQTTLIAYDKENSYIHLFGAREYIVSWYRNGKLISNNYALFCTPGGVYTVRVEKIPGNKQGSAGIAIFPTSIKNLKDF